MDIYQSILRPFLFSGLKVDPEQAHQQTLHLLSEWADHPLSVPLFQLLQRSCLFHHPALEQRLWGLPFANPVGLAAGFDKDGVAANLWSGFGFGFAELGTVTLHAQPGNPKPRLFRLPIDQAALNRMGFNNQGAAALAVRLEAIAALHPKPPAIPMGINLGKSKITPLETAAEDYRDSFEILSNWGDYFVVNVSSPNTPGLRSLQATDQLEPILSALCQANQRRSVPKPILIKIAPDLEWEAIADVLKLTQTYQLAGIIATNTTIRRDHLQTDIIAATGKSVREEAGGISGAPLRQRSTEVIRFIYQQTQGKLPIIGVGGIFTAADAWEKITAGASLLQVYTGWIYEGPWMVRRILKGLVQELEAHQLSNISEAIGLNALDLQSPLSTPPSPHSP
ncbi:MAG TPA: quinone-dependent dihydroorotate dehydrogenase [Coleofasciculaceae cyanobacterium]